MTFLQPAALAALPVAALPVVVHLIHLYRRRQVRWAAMIFLRAALRMNKGLSRLRQILILTCRVLAVAAILFVIARPLAGGWLGLTGGAPDTVLILLDRSASMEQQNLVSGLTKRVAGLRSVSKAIGDAVGTRSRLVLIDSALEKPILLPRADALLDLPQAGPTDTAADIPALMQSALDYITRNKTGRTDVWLLSDLQRTDWDASSGRWSSLRASFAALQGVRFHLLCYSQAAPDDLGIWVDHVARRAMGEKAALLLDIKLTRHAAHPQPLEVPLRVVINGAATTLRVTLNQNQLVMQACAIPIDKAVKRGWGYVELPADSFPANNTFYFVFDDPPVLRSVVVSDDDEISNPLSAALSASADPARQYACAVLGSKRAAEIAWSDTALVVWNAPIPKPGDALERQLKEQAAAGRAILFLPTESLDSTAIFGLQWNQWQSAPGGKPLSVEWWRNDAGLLANTQDGAALPLGTLEVSRHCAVAGDGIPLARIEGGGTLLMRSSMEQAQAVFFMGITPAPASSSLARDGVVMFALLQRALNQGAQTLGKAQQRLASSAALPPETSKWRAIQPKSDALMTEALPLRAGVFASDDRLVALNRPPGEDAPETLSAQILNETFAGLDFTVVADTLEEGRSLTNEVWRTFLLVMAVALLGEALLCMPPRRSVNQGKPLASPVS